MSTALTIHDYATNRGVKQLMAVEAGVRIVFEDGSAAIETNLSKIATRFSAPVQEWLRAYTRALTPRIALGWGLVDQYGSSIRNNIAFSSDQGYQVERVVLATGKAHGWKSGMYYATNRRHGGADTYWMTTLTSVSTFRTHNVVTARGSNNTKVVSNGDGTCTLQVLPGARVALLEVINRWYTAHLGKPYKLFVSGARPVSDRAKQLGLLSDVKVPWRKAEGDYMRLSALNLVHFVDGADASNALHDQGPPSSEKSLGVLSDWFDNSCKRVRVKLGLQRTVSLRKVDLRGIKKHNTPDEWLCRLKFGKYFVLLEGSDEECEMIDHAVLVDAKAGLIYDWAERYAIKFCPEGLACCVGDATFLGILEARSVHFAEATESNRKSRRKSRKKNKVAKKA